MPKPDYTAQMRQYFDEKAANWDNICHHDTAKLHIIISLAAPALCSRLLDIGCGTGIMIKPLLAVNPRELLAVDLAPLMIEQSALKHNDTRLRLLAIDFFDLAENGFDLAMLYSVYPHFPEKEKLVQQTAKCLKNNGRFMIAHSESRHTINKRHQDTQTAQLSQSLKPAAEEAKMWQKSFDIDILVDTDQLYIISGLRK